MPSLEMMPLQPWPISSFDDTHDYDDRCHQGHLFVFVIIHSSQGCCKQSKAVAVATALMRSSGFSTAHEQQEAQGPIGRQTPQTQVHPPQQDPAEHQLSGKSQQAPR